MTPRLAGDKRIVWDEQRGTYLLLESEAVTFLSETAAAILLACKGRDSVESIIESLRDRFKSVEVAEVVAFLNAACERRWLVDLPPAVEKTARAAGAQEPFSFAAAADRATAGVAAPLSLTAELSHACPLSCAYCSNPLELIARGAELTTGQWLDIIEQARALGVWQLHFSGGEPLVRSDLETLVTRAAGLGLYTNLITSGIGLPQRLEELHRAGLDAVQISFQDCDRQSASAIAGGDFLSAKKKAAAAVNEQGMPLVINIVLHRLNISRIRQMIAMAAAFDPIRIELANVQFHGWAQANEAVLLPTPEQLQQAEQIFRAARHENPEIAFVWVRSDYYQSYPKACMGGWGKRHLVVCPDGTVLPCLSARVLPGLSFAQVPGRSLADIWYDSESFNVFRGCEWMKDPCRQCPNKSIDFGGCRCQAFMLTGDAAAADPVCHLSDSHWRIEARLESAAAMSIVQKEDSSSLILRGE